MATALIHSYGSVKPLELRLPVAKSTCETALKEVGKILQLRKESLDVFALFCGEMDKPIKVLQPSDIVPVGTELSLQRWYMQTDEYKAIRHDDAAIHHLCCEARAKIQRGDMHPSDEQLQQLEDFSDPFFPTERQYLEVAMKVSGYSMLVARGCTVVEALEDNAVTLCPGTLVTVSMDLCGLSVKCEGELQRPMLHWPWTVVRRWKRSASAETTYIKFEVCTILYRNRLLKPLSWSRCVSRSRMLAY